METIDKVIKSAQLEFADDLSRFQRASMIYACVIYDIVTRRVTNSTIEMCKHALTINPEEKSPDFIIALVNWTDLEEDKETFIFIASTLVPLAKDYLDDEKLIGLLRISADDFYNSTKE